ncbi:MAG: transposase [Bacteroidales bacterium]|nr:transposase [Bacteroidales bacterium]
MPKYAVLDKDTTKKEIMPHLSIAKRGFICKFDLLSIVMAMLFKLKTGCQWVHLPECHFIEGEIPSYKTVYYHYRQWCKLGDWEKCFPGW